MEKAKRFLIGVLAMIVLCVGFVSCGGTGANSSPNLSSQANYCASDGHNYKPQVTQEQTCQQEGIKTYTCSICGLYYHVNDGIGPHVYNANRECIYCGIKDLYESDTSIEEIFSEEESSSEESNVVIESSGEEESSSEKESVRHYPYAIGDVVEDFSLTLSDGSTFTLSEALQEKKLVIIKFWATWCTPCKSEWAAMSEAFYEYQEDVLILCISITDTNEALVEYKEEAGLPFAMACDSLNLQDEFGVSAIPYKFIIDQNGVLVERKLGAVTNASEYVKIFERYCTD